MPTLPFSLTNYQLMRYLFSTLFFACIVTFLNAQQSEDYFLSQPTLTPDGNTVIFTYEGDLWKAIVPNGEATRLTAMQGYETSPKVSPDGKWLAFTGRQTGNAEIYIMPLSGGDIKQLTWHSSNDEVNSWSWDSKTIYFTSGRLGNISGFKIGIEGGTPKVLFGDYFFLYDHNIFEHPGDGEIFFNDTWESSNQVQRKRYKGPFNPDIQSYNIKTKQYKRYTDWKGKDFGATLDKQGDIYFISDEGNDQYNLYTFINGKKTSLTQFPSSIKNASVNANGGKVVFEKDYQLWLYDVASKKANKLNISILRNNNILPAEKDFDVKNDISAFDISPDGKKLVFVARGELFVSDVEGKFINKIERGSTERVSEVKWLKDNKTILFNQTLHGYENWYTIAADGSAGLKQITADEKSNRNISVDKDRTKAVYLSGRNEVCIIDLKTLQPKTIVHDEIWGFQNSSPQFSPNGDYIVFTAYRNFEQDIMIYNTKTNKTIDLTKTGISEASPAWSPDGKYIYFISSRTQPTYPFGFQDPKVYRVALEKFDDPFKSDKYEELFKEEKKDTASKKDSTKKETKPKIDSVENAVSIDTIDIMDRLEQVSPDFGSQYLINVFQDDDKTIAFYISNHAEGKFALWKTTYEPFEERKTEMIKGASGAGDVQQNNGKFYALINGGIYKLNNDANKVDAIDITYTFRRDLQGEFTQMFEEAWAQMNENYYDENFHGADWKQVKTYYSKFLPYLNSRGDFRVLLNDMLGELNSSHQGFYTFGSDENIMLKSQTMETGIMFDNTDPYKVSYVLKNSAADKKDVDVKPGDKLVKVDGTSVNEKMNRNYYFTKPSADDEIDLTFARGGKTFDVKIHPQTSLYTNLYDQWIEKNKDRVAEKSNNRIAYGYMKNMGQYELDQFLIQMTEQLEGKDGLIFDLRYNTGGNVHDKVLQFLSQRSYLQWKYRQGQFAKQPNFAPSDKPIVLLVNEQSLSDAEMTTQGFKALKLGTIIGNETYHWIIFTSGTGLVDGSFIRLPSWGCFTLDGKDLEKNGVSPDILIINTFQDKLNGNDPQIDKAVEEILKKAGSK